MGLAPHLASRGLGGFGKTQVAVVYAYRYQQIYQAVLWARAESSESVISSYIVLAQLCCGGGRTVLVEGRQGPYEQAQVDSFEKAKAALAA